MRLFKYFLYISVFWISACNGNDAGIGSGSNDKVIYAIETVSGMIKIIRKGEGADKIYEFGLDGKKITSLSGLFTMEISSYYPKPPKTRLLLIAENSGGTACPVLFQIVNIKRNKIAKVSEEFGTCSEIVKTKFVNGLWYVSIEGYKFNSKKTWVYDEKINKLREHN